MSFIAFEFVKNKTIFLPLSKIILKKEMIKKLLFFIVLFQIPILFYSQELTEVEKENLKKAEALFEEGKYADALPMYSQLLSIHGRNIDFNLKYAICLVETNTDLKSAKKYLDYVKRVEPQNALVYYYLGYIYHLWYKFSDAILYYKKFKELANAKQRKKYDVDQQIRMCENGLELINYVSELVVLENKKVKRENFWYSYRLNDFGGKLIVTPKDFRSKGDEKAGYKGLTFMWDNHLFFFASHGDSKKGNLDLYQATQTQSGDWLIERLPAPVNSPYDEEFPYLAPDGKTLYFSSKGHTSMGGYDVFMSVYDSLSHTWSKPVNLDFPINTPYDDILYVTDKEDKYAYFASQRETDYKHIYVYKILVDKNPKKRKTEGLEDIYEQAKLKVSPLAENGELPSAGTDTNEVAALPDDMVKNETSQDTSSFKPIDTGKMVIEDIKNELVNDIAIIESEREKAKSAENTVYRELIASKKAADDLKNKLEEYLQTTDNPDTSYIDKLADDYANALIKQVAIADVLNRIKKQNDEFLTKTDKIVREYNNLIKNETDPNKLTAEAESIRKKYKDLKYESFFDVDKEKEDIYTKRKYVEKKLNETEEKIAELESDIRETEKEIESKEAEKENKELSESEKNAIDSEIKQLKNYITEVESDIKKYKKEILKLESRQEKLLAQENVLTGAHEKLITENEVRRPEPKDVESILSQSEVLKNRLEKYDNGIANAEVSESAYRKTIAAAAVLVDDNQVAKNKLLAFENKASNENPEVAENGENELIAENPVGNDKNNAENVNEEIPVFDSNGNVVASNNVNNDNEVSQQNKDNQEFVATTDNPVAGQAKEESGTNNVNGNITEESNDTSLLANNNINAESTQGTDVNKGNGEGVNQQAGNYGNNEIKSAEGGEFVTESKNGLATENAGTAAANDTVIAKDELNRVLEQNSIIAEEKGTNENYVEKEKPEVIVSEVNDIKQVSELMPELFDTTSSIEIPQDEKLLLTEHILKSKMENEKLRLQALQNALDKGNIIAEKDDVKAQLEELKMQIKADSLMIAQVEKNLIEKEYRNEPEFAEKEIVNEFLEKELKSKSILSGDEQKYYLDKVSKIDSLLKIDSTDVSVLEAASLTNEMLFERIATKLDSAIGKSAENGKAKYLVASAKAMFDMAMKIDEDAKEEKDKTEKINKYHSSVLLKQAAVKTLLKADEYIKNSDESKLVIPPIALRNPEDMEELKQNLGRIVAEERTLAVLQNEMNKLSYKIISDTTLSSKDIKKINKKLSSIKKELKEKYNNILEADSNVYSINETYLTYLANEYPVDNPEEFTTYVNSATKLFNKAITKKMQAANEQSEDNKIYLLKEADKLYKQALQMQNIALNKVLFGVENSPLLSVSGKNAVSPLVVASEISGDDTGLPDLNDRAVINKNYRADDKDEWFYAFDNDKEIKSMVKTLKESEQLIAKNEYDIEHSKNPERIKNAKADLKYLEKVRKQLISDLGSMIYDNETLKQKLLDVKLEEKRQSAQLSPDEEKFVKVLQLKARNYNKKADKILKEDLKKVSDDKVKAKLVLVAKQYKEMATRAKMEELAVYSGVADKQQIAQVVNRKAETEALADYQKGFDAKKIIARYEKPKTQNKNKIVFRKASENLQSNIIVPEASIMVNATKNMVSGQTYPIAVTIDSIGYSSLAKLKIAYPGYVDVQVTDFPQNADTVSTDTAMNFVWLKYDGNKPVNIALSLKPQNIMSYDDTLLIQFSYLYNNKIRKITRKIPVRFESAPLAEASADNTGNGQVDEKQVVTGANEGASNVVDNTQAVIEDTTAAILANNEAKAQQVQQESNVENKSDVAENQQDLQPDNTTQSAKESQVSEASQVKNDNAVVNNYVSSENEIVPFVKLEKSYYNETNPIPVNPPLPEGIVYKIQIGAFFKLVPDTTFKVKPVSVEKAEGSRYYKYLFGEFMTYDGAAVALKKVRSMGYPGAFIVAYKNGKRIPVYLARNEQKSSPGYADLASAETTAVSGGTSYKPSVTVGEAKTSTSAVKGLKPVPSDRKLYTVQIGVFKNTPDAAFLNAFDDMYYEKTPYGFTRYFTGVFDSYEQAIARRNYARKRGIRDAFIVMYDSGKRKLTGGQPVQVAQQKQVSAGSIQPVKDTSEVRFSVQIGAFKRSVSLEEIAKGVASIRNYEVSFIKSGDYTIFVAGNFKSYSKARDLANILRNEGLKDAFVIAIQNGRKIPLQQVMKR